MKTPFFNDISEEDRVGVSIGVIQRGREKVLVQPFILPPYEDDEVVLEVAVAGICGTDLHQFRNNRTLRSKPEGHEYVGKVVARGKDVVSPQIGQRVVVDPFLSSSCGACENCQIGLTFHCSKRTKLIGVGGFGQYVVTRAKGCFLLPDTIDDTLGALVEPLAVASHAARMLSNVSGSRGIVIGAGTVGLCALAAVIEAGASEVFVIAKYPAQQELALEMGAAGVISVDSLKEVDEIRQMFPKGLDFVIEAVGGEAQTLNLACDFLRPQGELVVMGAFNPGFMAVETYRHLVKEVTVRHSNCYGVKEGIHDFEFAIAHLVRKGRQLKRLVSHEFSLDLAEEAFRVANNKQQGVFKVQIRMPENKTYKILRRLETIEFSQDREGSGRFTEVGFSHSESWGRWSDGRDISLIFDQPFPSDITIMLRGRAFGPNEGKDFLVKVGTKSRTFNLTSVQDNQVWLEFNDVAGERQITISIPEPASPFSLGLGSDHRMLGIGLVQMLILSLE